MSRPIMEAINLSHYYQKQNKERIQVLDHVQLQIQEGDFISIQGKSGSGKSTLLQILGGLITPSEGKVKSEGRSIQSFKEKELAYYRRKTIGFVFQSYHLFSNMTAIKNIEEPLFYAGVKKNERRKIAEEKLELVGLGGKMQNKVEELSGGQQQRVSIARALINEPDILLADEPTGNLDGETEEQIMKIFDYINQTLNKTIIVVTHSDKVAEHAQRNMIIENGRMKEKKSSTIFF